MKLKSRKTKIMGEYTRVLVDLILGNYDWGTGRI